MNLIDGFVSDGGKNAVFQEKFMFTLLEGLRDIKVAVWNSNTLSTDDFIGNATYVTSYDCLFMLLNTRFRFEIESFCWVFCCCVGFNCRRFFLRDMTTVPGLCRLKLGGNNFGFTCFGSFALSI